MIRFRLSSSLSAIGVSVAALMVSPAVVARTCEPPQLVKVATTSEIRAFVRGKDMKVLTFVGYSGAGYQNSSAMLESVRRTLSRHDPARTIVNVGATSQGIGAAYQLAKDKGFATMGIVSVLARDEKVPLSPCVDFVFYVQDRSWGGLTPGGAELSPTSSAIVSVSSTIVGIGGGDIARDEMLAARREGKSVTFIPADMNHRIAREKASKSNTPPPTDFRGAAHEALARDG